MNTKATKLAPKTRATAAHPRKRAGRPVGSLSPVNLERVMAQEGQIIAAQLRGALAGDPGCARICLELINKLPPPTIVINLGETDERQQQQKTSTESLLS